MATQYWVRGPAGIQGPFDLSRIRVLADSGGLAPQLELSIDGQNWRTAASMATEISAEIGQGTAASQVTPTAKGATSPPDPTKPSVWSAIAFVAAGLAILYATGWNVLWGQWLLDHDGHQLIAYTGDIYIQHGLALRVNGLYYGLTFAARYFDAPFISWIGFGIAWGLFGSAMRRIPG